MSSDARTPRGRQILLRSCVHCDALDHTWTRPAHGLSKCERNNLRSHRREMCALATPLSRCLGSFDVSQRGVRSRSARLCSSHNLRPPAATPHGACVKRSSLSDRGHWAALWPPHRVKSLALHRLIPLGLAEGEHRAMARLYPMRSPDRDARQTARAVPRRACGS